MHPTQTWRARPAMRRLVAALLIIAPVTVLLATYLPGGLWMPARWVFLTLLAAGILEAVGSKEVGARRTIANVGAVAAVLVLCGTIGAARFGVQVAAFTHLGTLILAVFGYALIARWQGAVGHTLVGWACATVAALAVGLWEKLTGLHLPGNLPAAEYANVIQGWNLPSSFFDNPNLFGYFLCLVILLAPLGFAMAGPKLRWLLPPLALLALVELMWTSSRISLLAVTLGLALWALARRWSRIALVIGAVVGAVLITLEIGPGAAIMHQGRQLIENLQWGGLTSSGSRLELLRGGWWMAESSGWLGVGPGNFVILAGSPDNPHRIGMVNPHSGLAEVLAEYGAPSLVALLVVTVTGIVVALRAVRRLEGTWQMTAWATVVLLATWPLLSHAHSSWLRQPLVAGHLATAVLLLATLEIRRRFADAAH